MTEKSVLRLFARPCRNKEDEMAEWKCSKCGYTATSDKPPEKCPMCKEKCEFVDVSCYIPECGKTGMDTRLR
jgi:rubrerythrin